LAAIAAGAPIVPVPWADREEDFRKQFLDVIERQCGPQRSASPEELHGSWMQAYLVNGWVYGEPYDREKRVHPDLVPYAQLGQLERDKDAVFVALCEIVRFRVVPKWSPLLAIEGLLEAAETFGVKAPELEAECRRHQQELQEREARYGAEDDLDGEYDEDDETCVDEDDEDEAGA